MAEKEASENDAAAAIDFLPLEMEVDREIDSVFVPTVKKAQRATEEPKAAGQTRNSPESRPGPGIQESAAITGAGFDLDALQVEIDKEIDSIFVSAVKPERKEGPVNAGHHEQPKSVQGRSPEMDEQNLRGARKAEGPSTEESKAAGQTRNSSESGRGVQESAGITGAGFDLDALQVEIDKEIDSIFVSAVKPERKEGPVHAGNHEQPKSVQGRSPEMDEQNLQGARKAEGPSTEESKAAGQTRNSSESGRGAQESAGITGAGFNLDAFQVEIDKEIDGLFVPAVKPQRNEEPVQIGHHEQTKSVQDKSPVTEEQSLRGARKAEGPSTQESKAAGQTINFFESTPGPGIQESAASTGAGFNLDAFQVEIDKEIDGLFVPAVKPERNEGPVQTGHHEQTKSVQDKSPVTEEQSLRGARKAEGPSTEESKAAGQTINFFESTPGPGIQESAASTGAGFNLDSLQVEIDKEIDSLFVPAVEPERNEGTVQTADHEQPKSVQDKSPKMDEQDLRDTRKAGGPSLEPSHGAALRAKYDESPPDNAFDSERYHSHELSKLIETFNAAYLSLDWEFSRENILKLLAALHQLEPFASRYADAGSVLRILNVILKRLADKPHAINSRLVKLIRDSQGLLAHMLLVEGEIGPDEKQRLKDLIESFHELRQKALAAKAKAARPRAGDTAQFLLPSQEPQPPAEARPERILPEPDTDSLQEFLELVEKTYSLSENLEVIGTQIARLRQIEAMLSKTPALVPVAQRLNGIGRALEDQVDTVRNKRGALIDRISRIKKSETGWAHGEIKTQKGEGAEYLEAQAAAGSQLAERMMLHLIALDGQTLALPASCVLRVAQSSTKKGLRILERGYATLANFKPCLRGIKSEVLGNWTELPSKILRSYRFELVALDSFNQAGAAGQIAVLASDGEKHAILFAESADFIADAGIGGGPQAEGPREAVETLSCLLASVFEPCSQTLPPDQLSSASSMAGQYQRR